MSASCARLVGGEVAERQRDGRHGVAGLALAVDVGREPLVDSPRPRARRSTAGTASRAAALVEVARRSGRYEVQRSSCGRIARSSSTRRRNSSMPSLATRNLMRARLRFAFSPRRAKTRAIACTAGSSSSTGAVLVEQLGLVRRGAEAAADVEVEAAALDAVHAPSLRAMAPKSCIITSPQASPRAAGEGDLELAPEVLAVRVAEQEAEERVRVGRDVEGLGVADAGQRAGGDVAHAVAAGLAGGDADRGQAAHQVGRVVDVDVVELDVLARGDVQDRRPSTPRPARPSRRAAPGVHAAVGDLDAQHARARPRASRGPWSARRPGSRAAGVATPSWRWPLS